MVEVQQQQELRDVLQSAQSALEGGRPQEAVGACLHVLRHYPDAITALRLLGEAYLEAGRSQEAARAFDKALTLDPQNVLARVGLGVIAEDRGEDERAIGMFRLAWEIEPTLPQLRSELVRLYRKRYGAGGRLRLTRVALANLHKRNDDLLRAIAQLRQLHGEDPNRVEVALSLAEVLWRHYEDDDAALLCQFLLAERPRTARALLLLASIQGDSGPADGPSADELLATARGFDPDLALTSELIALRPSETLLAFAGDVPTVPPFDPASAPPDGTDELLGSGASDTTPLTRWEDIASGLTSESAGIRSATTMGVVGDGVPTAAADPAADDVDQLFAAIDRELALANEHGTGGLPETLPFELPALEEAPAPPAAEWEEPGEDAMAPAPDEPSAVERLTANWDNIDNELAAARPSDDAPTGMTGMLSALALDDLDAELAPFDIDKDSTEAEETISFDPSRFSLPPLDGEDDEDLDAELADAAVDGDIAPFDLDATGPRRKTSGLSFSELVGKDDVKLPTAPSFPDAQPEEGRAVADAASIFQTRELSSLPVDALLEIQAAGDTDALGDTRVLVPETRPIAGGEATEAGEDSVVAAAAQPAAEEPIGEAVAEAVAAEAEVGDARVSSSTSELDKLLSEGAPRLAAPAPSEHYPVDATRPLLADEALTLGLAAVTPTDEDHLVSKAPAPPAEEGEVGMDKLFNRLRHRKHEQMQTGELLVNRRLGSGVTPGVDTGEIAGPLRTPKGREEHLPMADAALDDGHDEAAPAGDTADFLAAIVGEESPTAGDAPGVAAGEDAPIVADDESWLTALVADPAVADEGWTPGDATTDDAIAADRVNGHAAARHENSDASPAGGWAALLDTPARDEMPEQPEPPTAWAAGGEDAPHWGDEAIEQVVSPPVQAESALRADGLAGSFPLIPTPANVRSARPIPRQTEQLRTLTTMVEAQPDNHFARLTLAVAYSSGRQPEQALNEYRRLIKDADELVPEVVERLKEMIADGDAPARAHRVLGDAYMKLGSFDLAMAEFQRALGARPRAAK